MTQMQPKYDKIGIHYNQTRKADTYLASRLLHHLNPNESGHYLDIGCGTGNYTDALQRRGFQFVGIDPSNEMLANAKLRNPKIDWQIGSAEKTGLEENSIDGIIACLTIHHWPDLELAFTELNRLLKPKRRLVIFTSTPKQMKGYWLNHYFPEMLKDSMSQMPAFEKVEKAMNSSGFEIAQTERYSVKQDLQDQFLYCGKEKPEVYLDDKVRNGISSFSSLANKREVEQGLTELRKDMDSGKIEEVQASYENHHGDYLYIIGRS